PAMYFVDAQGRIRYRQYGEGHYDDLERVIQSLLKERGGADVPGGIVTPAGPGTQADVGAGLASSPETYLGYEQAEGFASAGGLAKDQDKSYAPPPTLSFNRWALAGRWRVERERAIALDATARVTYRFRARDLHLVLGPADDGRPIHF